MHKEHSLDLEVVERPPARVWVHESEADEATLKKRGLSRPAGFHVLPRRWVVERTFAWISKYRRMSKDYETLIPIPENRFTKSITPLHSPFPPFLDSRWSLLPRRREPKNDKNERCL